jgi:hypothetical protein
MAWVTIWNKFDYVMKMRARVNKPVCWTDVLNVKISDIRAVVQGAITTDPSVGSITRETAYTYLTPTQTQDTLTISTGKVVPILIDEADRYQQTYVSQMELADYQGKLLSEYVEAQMLAQHGSFTDFGATDLANTGADDTTAITVSASNIDDLIRAIKRKIYSNNGVDMAVEKGLFIVWRADDFEFLEAFVQANGFTEADIALKNGIPVQKAFRYMGVDHYLSTQHTAGHLFAGIKGCFEIGILRGTYGKAKFIEDPLNVSGLGVVTRIDYGWNQPAYYLEFSVDVNVS